MSTLLPVDENTNPIQVLRLRDLATHRITVTAVSARTSVAFNPTTRVVTLVATTPMFVRFGNATVAATVTDHYIPANVPIDVAIGGDKNFQATFAAAIRAATDGVLYISERH